MSSPPINPSTHHHIALFLALHYTKIHKGYRKLLDFRKSEDFLKRLAHTWHLKSKKRVMMFYFENATGSDLVKDHWDSNESTIHGGNTGSDRLAGNVCKKAWLLVCFRSTS